jgi:hypothetical protein
MIVIGQNSFLLIVGELGIAAGRCPDKPRASAARAPASGGHTNVESCPSNAESKVEGISSDDDVLP